MRIPLLSYPSYLSYLSYIPTLLSLSLGKSFSLSSPTLSENPAPPSDHILTTRTPHPKPTPPHNIISSSFATSPTLLHNVYYSAYILYNYYLIILYNTIHRPQTDARAIPPRKENHAILRDPIDPTPTERLLRHGVAFPRPPGRSRTRAQIDQGDDDARRHTTPLR